MTVRTDDTPHLGERVKVYRSLGGKPQAAEFVGYEEDGATGTTGAGTSLPGPGPTSGPGSGPGSGGTLVVLRVLDKMGRGKEPEPGSVPEKGDLVCFTLFEHEQRGGAKLPDPQDTPWTHGGPPGETGTAPQPDAVTDEDIL